MKAVLIAVLIFFVNQAYAEEYIEHLLQGQNEDGSYGEKNCEVVTSSLLYSMLYNGRSPYSKDFGLKVTGMLTYLHKSVLKLKNEEVDGRHLYVLWALCEAYRSTGEEDAKKNATSLFKHIKKKVYLDDKANFGKLNTRENFAMMIRTMRAVVKLGLSEDKLSDLMEDFSNSVLSKYGYSAEVPFGLHLVNRIWRIMEFKAMPDVVGDKAEIQRYEIGLNNDSPKIRKQILMECKKLPLGKLATLVDSIEKSEVTELQMVAKELGAFCKFSYNFPNALPDLNNISINWLSLYSSYSFTYCHHKRKPVRRQLNAFMNFNETDLVKNLNLNIPRVLKSLSNIEHEKVVRAFFGEMNMMNRNIVPMRKKEWKSLYFEEVPFQEEGLDLVD